jgi:GT2 family glycosyltransferase
MQNVACAPVGFVEVLTPFVVAGWALDAHAPQLALDLCLQIDGEIVATFRPQRRRPAIAEHLGWDAERIGLVWFEMPLPVSVANGEAHTVQILVAADGSELPADHQHVRWEPTQHDWKLHAAALPASDRGQRDRATPPKVSIVVLNRNGAGLLEALFSSWQRHHNPACSVEWIVIDHASHDESLDCLRRWQSRINLRFLALRRNDSFSASCNRGARLARGAYLLFLNNDIVWCMDALPPMLDTLGRPEVAAVGLKLLKAAPVGRCAPHTEIQHLGIRFTQNEDSYWPYEANPLSDGAEQLHTAQAVPALTGAVLLCRKKDFVRTGGFDPAYFYGFEDVAWCLRLRQLNGGQLICRNDLAAIHRHGHTRLTGRESGVFERMARNADVLQDQWGPWLKRYWWSSLLTQDHGLSNERLSIGVTIGKQPGTRDVAWARSLQTALPQARIVWVPVEGAAPDARGLHILLATRANTVPSSVRNQRPDLLILAGIQGPLAPWLRNPGWHDFSACVVRSAATQQAVRQHGGPWAERYSAERPLGRYLDPIPPLRIEIWVPRNEKKDRIRWRDARNLQNQLAQDGAISWIRVLDHPADAPNAPPMQRVADLA